MTTETELRHLLEMAAKAHGLNGRVVGTCFQVDDVKNLTRHKYDWFGDDGDNARMRSALKVDVSWYVDSVECSRYDFWHSEHYADHNGDSDAALRMCALKVAAMIGEEME